MKNLFQAKDRAKHSTRVNLIGIISLISILSGILLFLNNEQQQEQILNSYCGEFGFYGKSLVLMKDGTFRFYYAGCSQVSGYEKGRWSRNGTIVTLDKNILDELDYNTFIDIVKKNGMRVSEY